MGFGGVSVQGGRGELFLLAVLGNVPSGAPAAYKIARI